MTHTLTFRMHDGTIHGVEVTTAQALCVFPVGFPPRRSTSCQRKVVERGPQVVAEFGNDQPDTGIRRVPAHVEDVLAGLAVEVTKDAAILIYEEGAPFSVEGCQVLVRAMQASVT